MIIEIDIQSDIPIYTQLVYEIKRGIYLGVLHQGDSLPSVRSLAGDIGINLHTVNKAYKTLVSEGVVEQVKKGYVISAKVPSEISPNYQKKLEKQIERLVIDTAIFGMDLSELVQEATRRIEGDVSHD